MARHALPAGRAGGVRCPRKLRAALEKTTRLHLKGVLPFGKKAHWKEDALRKLERITWILSPAAKSDADAAGGGDDDDDEQQALQVLSEHDPERWHAQVFRSADAGSLRRFPRPWDGEAMARHHLLGDKNLAVEQSIHTAYVRAIRSAERFVYIESQCFMLGLVPHWLWGES